MEIYSIELGSEKIFDEKTREYFQEVIKSYHNESYRSAIVMLYSIVICDILFKLQCLKDIYSDKTASDILIEIEKAQEEKPTSPDWENKLIKCVKEKTELLEMSDYENILSLQKHRHLSAHPILTKDYTLFKPNRETVRAHLRNMLEGILTKSPILSKKIIDEMIIDIAKSRDIFLEENKLKQYLETKYFNNLRFEIEYQLFKKLWKFVFKLEDVNCNENRKINYKTLKIIFYRHQIKILSKIKNENEYFSNLIHNESMIYLIKFLCENPKIFHLLNESAKVLIESFQKNNLNKNILSWFISVNIKEHINKIIDKYDTFEETKLSENTIEQIYRIVSENDCINEFYYFAIFLYGKSSSFNQADEKFSILIRQYYRNFSKEHLIDYLDKTNCNSQIYGRRKAKRDNTLIKLQCDIILGKDFDYEKYSNFEYFEESLDEE